MTSRDERSARVPISQSGTRLRPQRSHARSSVESSAQFGAVWGVNGYTTLEQADEIGRRLNLGPGGRLLDVGTGRGWPGLHLAQTTGCTVVGTDMPIEGLAVAAQRARSEARAGLAVAVVAAAGAHQPFRAGSFDAVVLTDVLC